MTRRPPLYIAALFALSLASIAGCIPARVRTGALFGLDQVHPPLVRVRLPHDEAALSVRGEGRTLVNAFVQGQDDPVTFSTEDRIAIKHTAHGIDVRGAGNVSLVKNAIGLSMYAEDPAKRLWVGQIPYSGALIFGTISGKPIVVNRLNLDSYLDGVLQPEMGERADSEYQAVKAQAVAARTYALRHLGQYEFAPYDLKADVSDQVYIGGSQKRDWVDHAVLETKGEVVTYNGNLIESYYHSTCGGRTDAIQDIWPKPPQPYLVSVDDSTYCSWSKYWSWTEEFSAKALLANLRAYRKASHAPIDDFHSISNIELVQGTPGGRVLAMTITTPAGLWTILSDQTRWALGRPSRPGSILPSSNFTLELRHDKHGHISGATARGKGYGHGVGLCQCGAIGRARAGQSYLTILPHYYSGTTIERAY